MGNLNGNEIEIETLVKLKMEILAQEKFSLS